MTFLFYTILILAYLIFILRIACFFLELNADSRICLTLAAFVFLAGILIPLHVYLCTNVSWYGEKVVSPEISIDFKHSFLSKVDIEPLLGEGISRDEEGNYFITIIDHRIHSKDYDKTPDIEISIVPENATLRKARATLTITQLAMENPPAWFSSYVSKNQTTTLDDKFTFTIYGSKVRYNENSDVEPTKYHIVAKNKLGEVSTMLTVTRYPLYKACELYDANHPGHSAAVDIPLCKERADYIENNKPYSGSSSNSSNSNQTKPNNSSSRPNSASSTCSHYEAGRCWDSLEEEAYSQGQWDKLYGQYGDSYYESSGCDSICQSILEDAYDEGYGDY